ncbi:HNH endonuclease [Candidatus Dojkabacteria bacterium]|jgi:hypothetical protein|nr:HNH endonuclease [Candidatus Dojkabacteria bacterium]
MISTGNRFPLKQILPLCYSGKSLRVGGILYKKSKALKIGAAQDMICPACKKRAMYFEIFEDNSCSPPSSIIRAMFDHFDSDGTQSFMTIDHMFPKSKGGANTKNNLQAMCSACNFEKSDDIDPFTPVHNIVEVNWINKLCYVSYIRWYIKMFRKDISMGGWANGHTFLFVEIKQAIKRFQKVDNVSWMSACDAVHKSIPTNANKKQKVVAFLDNV